MVIWVASYPRSGNTFFRMLLHRFYGASYCSVYDSEPLINSLLEAPQQTAALEELAASPEPTFVKTHELPGSDDYPAIYLVRDGRDSAVSFAHYILSRRGVPVGSNRAAFLHTLGLVITQTLYGGWSPNVVAWLGRKGRTAIVEYSELIASPVETMRRAMSEIGMERPIAAAEVPVFADLNQTDPWFFRRGRTGGWREEMPPDLHQLFWRHHGTVMELLGYGDDEPAAGAESKGEPEVIAGRAFQLASSWYTMPAAGQQPTQSHLAVGKGATAEQARLACRGEAAERLSACWRPAVDSASRASFRQLSGGRGAIPGSELVLASPTQYATRAEWNQQHTGRDWIPDAPADTTEMDWTRVVSLTGAPDRDVPSAYCYFQHPERRQYCVADSVGCAAGETLPEAMLHGFLELVERDAVALWWYNRLQRPGLAIDSFEEPLFRSMAARLESEGRSLHVLDLTADLGIRAAVAVSATSDGRNVVMGFGAHLHQAHAVRRALAEVDQTLSLHLDYLPAQRASGELSLQDHSYLQPSGWADAAERGLPPMPPAAEQLTACLAIARGHGLEVLALDLTRKDIGTPVARVIVPGLRPSLPRFAPGRLYDVPVQMGWLAAPRNENELNPLGLFV